MNIIKHHFLISKSIPSFASEDMIYAQIERFKRSRRYWNDIVADRFLINGDYSCKK